MTRKTLLCLLLLGSSVASAQEYREDAFESPWLIGIGLGIVVWPGLRDVESATGDSFSKAGMEINISAHKNVGRFKAADIYLGAELGFFGTDSSIDGRREPVSQSGFYLGPSAKFDVGRSSRLKTYLELGLGWYNSDLVEFDCQNGGYGCDITDTYHTSDAFGGYIGGRIGRNFYTSFRVHFVDFGEVSGPGGITGDLGGPFYVLSGGFSF